MNQEADKTISILVTGDFSLTGRIEGICKRHGYERIYGNALPVLLNKDISITNLECPLTDAVVCVDKSGPSLKAGRECVAAIKAGGFDIAALANNHIMDQGAAGLAQTISACHGAGIQTVGAGENLAAAQQPLYRAVKGTTVAIVNCAEYEFSIATPDSAGANPLDPIDAYRQIQQAKKKADLVLVIVHGGHEYYPLPSPRMIKTCRFFADLGAAAVIGHHTHSPSGYEVYNGVPIFYSLGNFIFDWENHHHDAWYEGYFVTLTIAGTRVVDFVLHPYTQCKKDACLNMMEGIERQRFMERINKYSGEIPDAEAMEQRFQEFCESRGMEYLPIILSFGRIKRKLFKLGLYGGGRKRAHLLRLLNLFRCQAHKDVSVKVLESWHARIKRGNGRC